MKAQRNKQFEIKALLRTLRTQLNVTLNNLNKKSEIKKIVLLTITIFLIITLSLSFSFGLDNINSKINIDKNEVFLGEKINIKINKFFEDSLIIINCTSENKKETYRIFNIKNSIAFTPEKQGDCTIYLIYRGIILDFKNFIVKNNEGEKNIEENKLLQNNYYNSSILKIDNNQIKKVEEKNSEEGYNILKTKGIENKKLSIKDSRKRDVDAKVRISDGKTNSKKVIIEFKNNSVKKIEFEDFNFNENSELRIEDVPGSEVDNFSGTAVRSFAIDPTGVEFSQAEFTYTASGNELWKCKNYDFALRKCNGRYEKIMDTIPGGTYSVKLTKEDPLYTEVWNNITCTCQNTGPNNDWAYCEVFCPINVPIPTNATDGYLSVVGYNVSIQTSYPAGGGITSGSGMHYGFFDRDQTKANSNESFIGVVAYDGPGTTTQLIYNSSMSSSGSTSFSKENCPTWSSGYCTWYIFLNSTAKSSKINRPVTVKITLNSINWTWNYTIPTPSNITVNLTSPSDNAALNFNNVNFTYIPVSSTPILNCSLYLNLSGSWAPVAFNNSIQNNSVNWINYTFLDEGIYIWNIRCFLEDSNSFAIYNRTLTIDTSAPVINLISPPDGNFSTESVVTFTYNVTDNFNIDNCSLIIDGEAVSTSYSVQKSTPQNITYALSNGVHNWSINCTDQAGNVNSSSTRSINVSATPVIWERRWYETSTSDYTSTANISLANSRDSTQNSISVSVPVSNSYTLVNALSPYISSNGAFVPAGTNVSFSGEFTTNPNNKGYVSWFLYRTSGTTDTLLCNYGDGGAGGAAISSTTTASCSIQNSTRILPTERLKLSIIYYNSFKNPVSVTHYWDEVRLSFFEFSSFITLGTLSVDLINPESDITIGQNESFNLTCEVNCTGGTCLNTLVYAQYNTSSSSFTNIGSSGNLVLSQGETNPRTLGDINQSYNTTFSIKGNVASTNNIRCIAVSNYSNSTGQTTRQVVVGDTTPPTVTLGNPENFSWQNNSTVIVYYTPSDNSAIANCTLYLNGEFNQSNSSIQNGIQQNFTLYGLQDDIYNWTVECTDDSGYTTTAPVKWFYVDTQKPSVELNQPEDLEVEIRSLVFFNFTAYDQMAPYLLCNLTVDNEVRISEINASNATPSVVNYTLSIGQHYWNVTCADLAQNYNTSVTRTFNVTNTPPEVILIFPPDNYWNSTGNITFLFNASDNYMLFNCSLIINGQFNQSKDFSQLVNGTNNFTLSEMKSGEYSWEVNCSDEANLSTKAGPQTLYIDTSIPSVELISPVDYYNSTSLALNLQFKAIDAYSPNLTCELTIDSILNATNITSQNNTIISLPLTFSDGSHNWSINCTDLAGNFNYSSTWHFNISEKPSVSLSSPAPNAWTNGNITFVFTASDNDGLFNCSLLINGKIYDTKNSSQLTDGGQNNFTVSELSEGINQQWSVLCFDSGVYFNSYSALARIFHVDRTPPTITLNYPTPSEEIKQKNISFNFTAIDNYASTIYCNLSINGEVNVSDIALSSGTSTLVNVSGFINGLYYWNVSCRDSAYNTNWSETRSFNVSIPPEVSLEYPLEEQWDNSENMTFYYYVSANAALTSCSLIINGQVNQTDYAPINEEYNNFTIYSIPEGLYLWSVNCTDETGLVGASVERNLTIDRKAPWIVLNSPAPDSILDSNYVTFNWTAFDNLASQLNCSLYVDLSLKEENIILENGSYANRTYIYSDGIYSWNVSCSDLATNNNWSETRNFTVEAPPNVTLDYPENNSWFNIENITFYYTPYDPIGIRYCEIYIDNLLKGNDSDIEKNVQNNFYITEIQEGIHNWTINCVDSDWNNYSPAPNIFYVDKTPPTVQLISPEENKELNQSSVLFNWSVQDNLALNITCNLTINNQLNQTNIDIYNNTFYNITIDNFKDNVYYWNITCYDSAANSYTTETRIFNVSVKPEIFLLSSENNTWLTNSIVTFYFNVTDNDGIENCSLILNSMKNKTNYNIMNNAQNNITTTLGEGIYNWSIECYDNGTFNNIGISEEQRVLYVDLTEPNIILYAPEHNANLTNNSAIFNFTATDSLSIEMICNLTLDNQTRIANAVVTNNTPYVETIYNLSYGMHYWNVTCKDYVNRTNTSLTYIFRVPRPDLKISSEDIIFIYETQNPEEGKQIIINATVYNIGASNAENFTVQFFDGDPSFGGEQIGNNTTTSLEANSYAYLTMNWTAKLGLHNIFVLIDTPLETNGSVEEENETNNIANKTILVQSWHYFYGNLSGSLLLSNLNRSYVYVWNVSEANNSNIFAADYDSDINWTSLKAISRDVNDNYASNDFSEIDTALGMSNYTDSVNRTYTTNDLPKSVMSFSVFNKLIENVPVVDSINNSNFITGILWDYSDGGTEFNGTQDLVFITKTNIGKQGSYEVCDYELRVPSNLKNYKSSTDSVAFYIEIK